MWGGAKSMKPEDWRLGLRERGAEKVTMSVAPPLDYGPDRRVKFLTAKRWQTSDNVTILMLL
jgi:hypothetical protein